MSKKTLVAGGGGFIGGHLAKELAGRGHQVRVVDIKPLDQWYQKTEGCENVVANLEEKDACMAAAEGMDEVFNLACNMGGMGFIENNRALCMLSVLINTHLLMAAKEHEVKKYLYSSSACVYAAGKQTDTAVTALNLGRSELVSINGMIDMISEIAGIEIEREHELDAPQGVRGRNSDNTLILDKLGWEPEIDLKTGLAETYAWIEEQIAKDERGEAVVS